MRKSRVVQLIALAIIAGIWVRSITDVPFAMFEYGALICVLVAFGLGIFYTTHYRIDVRHRSRYFLFSVLLCIPLAFTLGMLRLEYAIPEPCAENSRAVSCLYDTFDTFVAIIVREPDVREKNTRYQVRVDSVDGDILVFGPTYPVYTFGDVIEFQCVLEQPSYIEDFNYPGYLAKEGVYALCYQPEHIERVSHITYPRYTLRGVIQQLMMFRQFAKQRIDQSVPYPASTLVNSLVLGLKQELPERVRFFFSQTGTSHIVAISGMHLIIISTIITRIGYGLRLSRKQSVLAALIIIVFFIAMVGFKSSALRAGIFSAASILALYVQRPKRMFTVIVVTALLLLLYNPLVLVHDVGFGLSFMAVMGIMYIGPYVEKKLKRVPEGFFKLRTTLSTTISAQIGVAPLIMYQFGSISVISILANVLIVPLVSVLISLGIITILASSVSSTIASWIGIGIHIIVTYVLFIVETLGTLPFASIHIPLSAVGMITLYVMGILCGYIYTHKKVSVLVHSLKKQFFSEVSRSKETYVPYQEIISETIDLGVFEQEDIDEPQPLKKRVLSKKWLTLIVTISVIGMGIGIWVRTPQPSGVRITILDVGQGDAHLIQTSEGHTILIDGGPDDTIIEKLSQYMGASNHTIDMMILTHPHADHVTGLVEVLDRYQVDRVIGTGVLYDTSVYHTWQNMITEQEIPFEYAVAPKKYIFETDTGDVVFDIVYPFEDVSETVYEDVNESSIVVRMSYNGTRVLFTGDISVTNEQEMLDASINLQADILKVPHQGSDTSSSVEFLEAVHPTYAAIPVGKDNEFGHPSLRILRRLERAGALIYRTDNDGDIMFNIDQEGNIQVK